MKLEYQIGARWNKVQSHELLKYGIVVNEEEFSYIVINEILYDAVKHIFKDQRILKACAAKFNKKELDNANLFVLDGIGTNGYPQPDENFEYLRTTYDLKDYCEECGSGGIQNSLFRIEREPKLGKKKMFHLNWVFDELFVEIEFYNFEIKPLGVKCKPVLLKNGSESKTIVQLNIPQVSEEQEFIPSSYVQCDYCKRKKFQPLLRNFFPNYKNIDNFNMFKGVEFFGTGKQAFNRIIIDQELKEILVKGKIVKSTQLIPVAYE